MGRPKDQFSEDTYKNSLRSFSEAGKTILEFIDYLPENLRNNYKRYNEQFTDIIKNIMEGHWAKEDVTAYFEKVSSIVLEITSLTDSILREKLV